MLTILFGFALGGAFGAFEAPLKSGLTARAEAVRDGVYAGDAAKMKSVIDKSWTYYKRAHMHGGAIGAVALGGILLLAALERPRRSEPFRVTAECGTRSSFMQLIRAGGAAPGSSPRTSRGVSCSTSMPQSTSHLARTSKACDAWQPRRAGRLKT